MDFIIKLQDQRLTSFKELGEIMYLYPDASEKLITSSKFLKILKQEDEEKYRKLIELNHEVREHEEFIFLAQYIFQPFMNIRHHGYQFNSLKELGEKILSFAPIVDVYLKDFLKYHLLSKYMEMMNFHASEHILYQKILKLEKMFRENEHKAYFLLGFILSGCDIINYRNKQYKSAEEFFNDMTSSFHIADYSLMIEKSQYIIACLSYQNHEEIVDKYESFIKFMNSMEDKYESTREISKMVKK